MARSSWLDENAQSTVIDEKVQSMESFVQAMSDGIIDADELVAQEKRLVDIMKKVEPTLDDETHEHVTQLLCEMSAFSTMQTLNAIWEARPKTKFVG